MQLLNTEFYPNTTSYNIYNVTVCMLSYEFTVPHQQYKMCKWGSGRQHVGAVGNSPTKEAF